ncbi:hypothetical protein EYE40_11100 [Glaciihabitans arcticus]|uniref:Uncharacterized protein n=1 Tax=Glaciihabitans arcticus TaxID=2668039 RepID=A0A4Q9GSB9_9MICO|nr:hypothetical protein [Glaciihabitans arcticus]TBN57896.1 hypothetical protein EYE40_11100 [Glaciihabitans arcticus]
MTMNEPVQDGSNESLTSAQIDGIVEQTRGDLAAGHVTDLVEALRQRFTDAGISVTEAQLHSIAGEARS